MRTPITQPFSAASLPGRTAFAILGTSIALLAAGPVAQAGEGAAGSAAFEWDIELTSMDLNAGPVLLPLGPGWAPMLVDLHIGEAAAVASTGKAYAYSGQSPDGHDGGIVSQGGPANGDLFRVTSFFDVFFDITIMDLDSALNFGGAPDGAIPAVQFLGIGPAHMQNFYLAAADLSLPNFGLIPPPEAFPYIGHFNIEIPLGADLNGNGFLDKIKFTLAAHQVNGQNRTFITLPDGTVLDNFDSVLDLSGAVVDVQDDPPFSVTLTGPTTATSQLVGGVVPEASTHVAAVAVLGLAGWTLRRRFRR